MFVSGQAVSLGKKNLKPQQVVTVKLPSPASLGHGKDVQSAGLRIEYSGSPGSLVAQGWMVDAQIGFSFPFALHYPSNCNCSGDTQHLYGTGIMIGAAMSASGPIFSPLIATILEQLPGYRVRVENGVVNIARADTKDAPKNFLNLKIPQFQVDQANLYDANALLRLKINMTLHPERYRGGVAVDMGTAYLVKTALMQIVLLSQVIISPLEKS